MKPDIPLTTDDFATGPFRPHGRIDVWAEGNVVRLEATGPINREAIVALGAVWERLFAELPLSGPFASIIEVRRSLLISHEVLDAFRMFLRANDVAGRTPCAIAFVIAAEVEGASLMLTLVAATYADAGRPFAAFPGHDEAERWVRGHLAHDAASPDSARAPA